jgi:hypothetical protein
MNGDCGKQETENGIRIEKYVFSSLLVLFLLLTILTTLTSATPSSTKIMSEQVSSNQATIEKNYVLVHNGKTNDNISVDMTTTRWSAFFGNISLTVLLGDSSNNIIHSWNENQNVSGTTIFASTSPINNWSTANIVSGNVSVQNKYLKFGSNDNYANTFNESETFATERYNIPNTPFTRTNQNNQTGELKTYSLTQRTNQNRCGRQ